MTQYFPKQPRSLNNLKVELDLSNNATKSEKKAKIDIDKLKTVPTRLKNLKSAVDKLDYR